MIRCARACTNKRNGPIVCVRLTGHEALDTGAKKMFSSRQFWILYSTECHTHTEKTVGGKYKRFVVFLAILE